MSRRTITGAIALAALVAVGLLGWPALDEDEPSSRAEAVQQTEGDTTSAAQQAIAAHESAALGPDQPVPFSHRFHVSDLQLDCAYCHTESRRSSVAKMPSLDLCMGCHQVVGTGLTAIDTLRAYWNRGEQVPWQRIYKVPEFVQFKHQPHLRSNVACQECHGPVEEMDRVYKFADLSMGWCLSCHRDDPQATDVATNARLVRQAEIPPTPEGRQPVGLYPRAISSDYAGQRAPIDCAACHY